MSFVIWIRFMLSTRWIYSVTLPVLLIFFMVHDCSAIDLSDTPLDLQVVSALPNLMVLTDNSVIMDAELLTPDPDGLFQGRAYLFPDSAYTPQTDRVLGPGYDLSLSQRRSWRCQWNGYNAVFYNPLAAYHPWPNTQQTHFGLADLQRPWSNPSNTDSESPRLRLADAYYTVVSNFEAIVVPMAHYFTIDDLNGNGQWEEGEAVYLIIWVDTDEDGRLDVSDNLDNDRRCYYRFEDDGDGQVEDNELILLTDENEINRVRPIFINPQGGELRKKTDQEDLQNFANWASYYRRRLLSVKALASRFIAGAKSVHIGLYPLHGQSPMPVQNIQRSSGKVNVVDDQDEGFTAIGTWFAFNGEHAWSGTSLYSDQEGAVAVFRPDLPASGQYKVLAWWPCGCLDNDGVGIDVYLNAGQDRVRLEKSQFQNNPHGCGRWVELGVWEFSAGSGNSVQFICSGNGGMVLADAVQFLRMDGDDNDDDHTDQLLETIYRLNAGGDKDLRTALENIGRYFHRVQASEVGPSPLKTEASGGGCQRSLALMVSDGIWNGSFSSIGNADGNMGAPYADIWPNTLADVAMHYFGMDLAPDVPDLLCRSGCDHAAHQHMSTYAIALGGRGRIDRYDIDGNGLADEHGYTRDPCFGNPETQRPEWPQPTADETTCIDDFWHATINGRGRYADPQAENAINVDINRLKEAVRPEEIIGQLFLDDRLAEDRSVVYQTRYHGETWTGDVLAFEINPDSDEMNTNPDTAAWSAAQGLERLSENSDLRCIVTYGGRGQQPDGLPFRYTELSDLQKKLLGSDLKTDSEPDQRAAQLLAYIRGGSDAQFRKRHGYLGDIVHSIPLVSGNTLYVGANDGMLHAFDLSNGEERFAYVPHGVFGTLPKLAAHDYIDGHRFFVDGSPTVGDILVDQFQRHTYLVGGYGKGGLGYYCLLLRRQTRTWNGNEFGPYNSVFNVDDLGDSATERTVSQIVQWEYPRPNTAQDGMDNDLDGFSDEQGEFDADIGYSFGQGYAVNANAAGENEFRPVVIFPNGYNSARGSAVLYVLDAVTGGLLRKIDTGVGGDNGLSIPALIDTDFDRRIDYAYAGDLKGNLWKFDLTSEFPHQWGVAYGDDINNDGVIDAFHGDTPMPLFQSPGQPITARPDVIFSQNACAPQASGFMVIFGTGKFLGGSDRTDSNQQSIFGVWDYGEDSDDSEILGYLSDRSNGILSTGLRLVPQTVSNQTTMGGEVYREMSNNPVDYRFSEDILDGDGVSANNDGRDLQPNPIRDVGWFLDFPVAPHPDAEPGERVISNVAVRGGRAVVFSYVPETKPCTLGGKSWLYLVDTCFSAHPVETGHGNQDLMQIRKGRRFEGNLGAHPIIYKQRPALLLDQLLVGDAKGRVIKIPFKGETWGKVHWRQNIE